MLLFVLERAAAGMGLGASASAPQPEILKYANHVADRFNLRPDIQLNTRVERAAFDELTKLWSVTSVIDGKTVTAKLSCLATGCLSNARMPEIKGSIASRAKSTTPATGRMRPSDFTGQRSA